MPFDPSKPVEQTEIDAVLLRSQFNALNDKIEAQAATIAALQAQIADLQSQLANRAILPTMDAFDQSINDPPTQADLQKIADWGNALLAELNGTDS